MDRIKDILIKSEISIKQALKVMDKTAKKILFVVKNQNEIFGVITDGDIRRWILRGNSLGSNVAKIINKSPFLLKEGYSKEEAKEIMLSEKIECLPIVDANKRIVSAVWWTDLFDKDFKKQKSVDIPVVIMSGGEGKRLLPFTNVFPKSLMPIGNKPIIELIVDKFVEYGCKDFYLSVNYKSSLIKAYFNDLERDYSMSYVEEEEPLGTAGSLHLLKDKINSTFFVSNCDILIEADYADILEFHKNSGNKITLVGSMKHYTIPYGVCEIRNGGKLQGINEKPEYDFLVNTGMYVLEPDVLASIPANKFYHITDLINEYLKRQEKVGVYPISEKAWIDVGQLEQLQETIKRFEIQ